MTRASLIERIDAIRWTDDGLFLMAALTRSDPADEAAAVVLVAAAWLLGQEGDAPDAAMGDDIHGRLRDFGDLVHELRLRELRRSVAARHLAPREAGAPRPGHLPVRLRLVGGTDAAE